MCSVRIVVIRTGIIFPLAFSFTFHSQSDTYVEQRQIDTLNIGSHFIYLFCLSSLPLISLGLLRVSVTTPVMFCPGWKAESVWLKMMPKLKIPITVSAN